MYTEEDLRATFGALEDEAPDLVGVVTGMAARRKRRTTRRRRAGVLTAVAVVVGTLAGVAFALPNHPDSPVVAASQDHDLWQFPFAVDAIPGHQVSYLSRGGAHQRAWVTADDDPDSPVTLLVFSAGKYDPAAARAGEPVVVNGKSGFYRADMPCYCSGEPPVTGLAWEYAPNAWALVQNEGTKPVDRAAALRIADAVRFDRSTPLRVPFRVGYLPGGLRPGTSDTQGSGSMPPLRHGVVLGAGVILAGATPQDPGVYIDIAGPHPDLPVGEPSAISGGPFGPRVMVNLGSFAVQVGSGGHDGPNLPMDELLRIARSITSAGDIDDLATWIEAEQAVPVS
jgi:hypothetical protein